MDSTGGPPSTGVRTMRITCGRCRRWRGRLRLRDHAKITSQPPTWRRLSDRDRGEDRSSAPPTPPYVRVRIRRFDWLCVSTLDQGRKSKRREIGIRQGLVQSRALAHTPRAAPRACGFCRRLPAHTPPDQFRIPLAACLPLSPKGAPYAPPDPRIQIPQHRRGFAEAEIASPAAHIPGQFLQHIVHAPPPALCRDFPNPL